MTRWRLLLRSAAPGCRKLLVWTAFAFLLTSATLAQAPADDAKPVPVLTGSAGFISNFEGGQAHLDPIITSVVLVPVGQR